MTGQSSATKKASKTASQAPKTIEGAEAGYLANPLVVSMTALLSDLLANPGSLTPEVVAGLKANNAAEAHAAANTAQQEMLAKLGVTGNVRGGSAIRGTNDIAARLGETIASGNRTLDANAATQNRQDLIQVLNAVMAQLGQRYQFPRDIAQAQLGAGGILGQIAAQPTPLQSALGGLGGLVGNLASGGAFGAGGLFGGSK